MITRIVNFEECPYSIRHGRYGGQAGDKDGIIYNNENWIVKYPKSTRSMEGAALPEYTLSPLSEYIGSHIYEILGYPVHKTLLGIRNGQIVVACKDFQQHLGDLAEIRTIKNGANRQIRELKDENLPESATGDKVVLEELFLHFKYNPLLQTEGLVSRFWEMSIVDILIGNNDRNNGNWGLLYNQSENRYEIAPVYDNGNAFNNKTNDKRIEELLARESHDVILGERTIYTYRDKILSAKKLVSLDIPELKDAILKVVPLIEEKINEITEFIFQIPSEYKGIPVISESRKAYYAKSVEYRVEEILKPIYKKIAQDRGDENYELD